MDVVDRILFVTSHIILTAMLFIIPGYVEKTIKQTVSEECLK